MNEIDSLPMPQRRKLAALRRYAIEGVLSAVLMVCMSSFIILFEHPSSPVNQHIANAMARRACNGVIMGAVIAALIASPWGRRSGAHFNPAVTLAMWSIDKIRASDVPAYVLAQLTGATVGMAVSAAMLGASLSHPQVNFAVTQVGDRGVAWAFFAEFAMSFAMMFAVLLVSLRAKRAEWVPAIVGGLIATFIALEAPVSGMSLNPARTLASALVAHQYDTLWLYFCAPLVGMISAATVVHRWCVRRSTNPQHPPVHPLTEQG